MKTSYHLVASIEISWHDFRALHLAWAINYSFGKNATILFDQRKQQQQQEKQQQEQKLWKSEESQRGKVCWEKQGAFFLLKKSFCYLGKTHLDVYFKISANYLFQ